MTAGSDRWGSPLNLFQTLDARYNFTIDGAADAENHLLPRWWGPDSDESEDALSVHWGGERVYCNPPFSLVDQFLLKAHAAIEFGAPYTTVVMLIKAATDKVSWHEHVMKGAAAVGFFRGRLNYVTDKPSVGATFPSALVTYCMPPTGHYWRQAGPVFYAINRDGSVVP